MVSCRGFTKNKDEERDGWVVIGDGNRRARKGWKGMTEKTKLFERAVENANSARDGVAVDEVVFDECEWNEGEQDEGEEEQEDDIEYDG